MVASAEDRGPGRVLPLRGATAAPQPELPEFPSPAPRTHNLPSYTSAFVGRGAQIAEVTGLLAEHRLVTLVGTGGVGKTRLVLQVAASAAPGFRDGVWLVELSDVADGETVREAVLAALPDADWGSHSGLQLFDRLAEREMLLVLDNCEHVTADCAALAQQLLRRCPQLSVLVTSREPLQVAGERVWWVAPLGLPSPDDVEQAGADAAESVRLFVERGRSACPGFCLTAEVYPAVAEICRRLDGLPLALELAAARMAILSPAEIVERLADRFQLLRRRGPAIPRRHQSLLATLQASYDQLTGAEALLLARFGVFAGGSDLQAVEQVCSGGMLLSGDVLDGLEVLVAKSLVVVERSRPVTRYRMLESIRHFALTKLNDSHTFDALSECHARWCVLRAERVERDRRARQPEVWLATLEEEHDNFRAALSWARDHDRADLVLALGGALSWFWEAKGHFREGLDWLTWALAREPHGSDELRARALRSAGMLSWLEGGVAQAVPLVEESMALFRRAGNEEEAAGCVCSGALHLCANPALSLPALEADLSRVRVGDDVGLLALALVNCGVAHCSLSDAGRARTYFDECLALPLGADDDVVGAALLGRGRVALLVGDFDGAEALFRTALDVLQRAGNDDRQSAVLSWSGELHRVRGDYRRCRSMLADAAKLVVSGSPLSLARCTQFLGRLEASEGNLEAARALFAESLALPGAKDMPYHRVRSLQGLADLALICGERDDARALIDEALALATLNGDLQARGRALSDLSTLAGLSGDRDRAAQLGHQALELRERIGDCLGIVSSLEALAALARVDGRPLVAARLWGATQTARQTIRCPRPPAEAADTARHLEALATTLGSTAMARAWAQGTRMRLARAISYATKGWGSRTRPATGWDSLTRAERDVASIVGEGLTNREIADRLFVSPRTVSTHLEHIYRKVPVSDRRELSVMVSQRRFQVDPVS